MAINTYDVGDRIRCRVSFTDLDQNPADPTTVVAKVKDPTGNTSTYTDQVVNDAVGSYYIDVTLDQSGTWWYRFEGTGAVQAAEEQAFNVRDSRF